MKEIDTGTGETGIRFEVCRSSETSAEAGLWVGKIVWGGVGVYIEVGKIADTGVKTGCRDSNC